MGAIRCVRLDRSQSVPSPNPIFVGSVSTQEVVNEALADLLRVTAVTFDNGAVNQPHRHTTDQVLVATSGSGFVASDDDHYPLEPGDVAFIPAGTRHWHGANPDGTFTHLAILTPGHTEIDDDGSGWLLGDYRADRSIRGWMWRRCCSLGLGTLAQFRPELLESVAIGAVAITVPGCQNATIPRRSRQQLWTAAAAPVTGRVVARGAGSPCLGQPLFQSQGASQGRSA